MSNKKYDQEELKQRAFSLNTLPELQELSLELLQRRTEFLRLIIVNYKKTEEEVRAYFQVSESIDFVKELMTIVKERREVVLESEKAKAKKDAEASAKYNSIFRYEAKNYLSPSIYEVIANRAQAKM